MKIYLNRQPVQGPWGGANKVVVELVKRLEFLQHEVVFNLNHTDIDLIFCFDPRPNNFQEDYNSFLYYKNKFGCKIVQRVGDLGTHSKPELTNMVKQSIQYSDFLIFPSEWAKDWIGYTKNNFSVVHNAPLEIFHKYKNDKTIDNKINLITHHWSTNPKKGFSFYKQLDDFITDKFTFTYIGRLPNNMNFKNINYISATGDNDFLAKKLSEADIYVTASEEEAGANHVLEAMAAGLPVLYHKDGGSIVNYCRSIGESFHDFTTFKQSLDKVCKDFSSYKEKVMSYDKTVYCAISEYEKTICNLIK